MKRLTYFFACLIIVLGVAACEGPTGPPGPQGPPGSGGGVDLENEVFEVEANFNSENDYFEAFVLDPPIGANDVVLAFMLWEVNEGTDIWRALPQTVFLDEGLLKYEYDFTRNDFALFLEANFDRDLLSPVWTESQFFRIVLVPGKSLETNGMPETYEELKTWINLEDRTVRKERRQ